MKSIFKNDKYKKTRGGYSRLLKIFCQKCGGDICMYQKDGPGNLRSIATVFRQVQIIENIDTINRYGS